MGGAASRRRATADGMRLKLRYNESTRVVHVASISKLKQLSARLLSDYGFPVLLSYLDEDGDRITLASDNDLDELVRYMRAHQLLALDVRVDIDNGLGGGGGGTSSQGEAPSGGRVMMAENPPTRIRWRRGELIGEGAFGKVFLALNLTDGNLMAVKQIDIKPARLDEIAAMEKEISLVRSLRHRHIVRYLGSERHDLTLSIFVEYVPGGSIAHLLHKFGPFDETIIRSYTQQMLWGLLYLHTNDIAHRDIKGANILVDHDGTVKVSDFGGSINLADLEDKEGAMSSARGTAYWMAPEVIKQRASKHEWKKADVWSVACTVIEMATGRPPWANFSNPVTALYHIACTKAAPPMPERLSEECKDFLRLCFTTEPSARPDVEMLLQHSWINGSRATPSSAPTAASAAAAAAASAAASAAELTIEEEESEEETDGGESDAMLVSESEKETDLEQLPNPLDFDPVHLVDHNYSKDYANYGVPTKELLKSFQSHNSGRGGGQAPDPRMSRRRGRGDTKRAKKAVRKGGGAAALSTKDAQIRRLQDDIRRLQNKKRQAGGSASTSGDEAPPRAADARGESLAVALSAMNRNNAAAGLAVVDEAESLRAASRPTSMRAKTPVPPGTTH